MGIQVIEIRRAETHILFGDSRLVLLRKFKDQYRPATGHRLGNKVFQVVWGGTRVEQAVAHKGQELLKLRFGQDNGSGQGGVEACQDRSHWSSWTAQVGGQILTGRGVVQC